MPDHRMPTATIEPISEDRSLAIRRRLRSTGYVTLGRIECEYHDGAVVLRGRVPSYYAKQLAQTLVLGDPSVEAIENLIEVAYSDRSGTHT